MADSQDQTGGLKWILTEVWASAGISNNCLTEFTKDKSKIQSQFSGRYTIKALAFKDNMYTGAARQAAVAVKGVKDWAVGDYVLRSNAIIT